MCSQTNLAAAYPYQPETVYQIINRAVFNKDIATGSASSANYSSSGPTSSDDIKLQLPTPPGVECYLGAVGYSCTVDQYKAILNGTAEIVDWNVVKPAGGGGPILGVGLF